MADHLNTLGVAHGGIVDAPYGSGLSFRDPDNIALEFFSHLPERCHRTTGGPQSRQMLGIISSAGTLTASTSDPTEPTRLRPSSLAR